VATELANNLIFLVLYLHEIVPTSLMNENAKHSEMKHCSTIKLFTVASEAIANGYLFLFI